MRMVDIIRKKREGNPLNDEEIKFFVEGYTDGRIPDYQASALLMAICLNGMDDRETATLTMEMAAPSWIAPSFSVLGTGSPVTSILVSAPEMSKLPEQT